MPRLQVPDRRTTPLFLWGEKTSVHGETPTVFTAKPRACFLVSGSSCPGIILCMRPGKGSSAETQVTLQEFV
ncbi:hypothetical protein FPSE_08519 [Fusarium pseudograminearum CS3096]|uniref:Uncharacterized protein n=1 Tax=Fusarium pseudograminearum (strain CS3096) TaxID=1028729 RepID=K3VYU9_FUSPC|nr:hypothetical protein FPSE_08519 [Fusarium pseudograminearum CS3096]EKJ71280.1 hypothetical protein FPSE_08519 [Fusarium pseudograminearum CS3096]